MDSLLRLQREFQAHVLAPARSLPRQHIERRIAGTARLDASTRLAIYADGYRLRLVEALGVEFPCLQAVLGERGFDRACRAFIDAHPSREPNLRWYGSQLADFLAASRVWRRRPVLAELTAFEWRIGLAFDAADTPRLGVAAMAALPADAWPTLRFTPHPSLQRLALHWNAPELSKARAQGTALPKPRKARRARPWAIWRHDETPRFRRLDDDEAWALDALANGEPFGLICAGLCRWNAEDHSAALRAAGLLKGWITEQMISGVAA